MRGAGWAGFCQNKRMIQRVFISGLLSLLLCGCAGLSDLLRPDGAAPRAPIPFKTANRFTLPVAGSEVIGDTQIVIADVDDTLAALARRYDLGYDEIVGANPEVDAWLPTQGTRIVLPTRFVLPDAPREGIVINVAARRMFYFPPEEPHLVLTFPVGIGRDDWATPLGTATITDKVVDPTWYPPPSIRREHREKGDPLPAIVPPGPDNPLGSHALLLSMEGYLLHGTNKPGGVGMQVSHGCVRLYPEDIASIFDDIDVGTPVRIVDQPVLVGWVGDELYAQSYDADYHPGELHARIEAALRRRGRSGMKVPADERRLEALRRHRGITVSLTRRAPAVEALLRTATVVEQRVTVSD